MDELLIDDKKYISSKQAAKLTGYAKDYIGQLCREGRVAARLVGRSWYVLETAIQDHRFGSEGKDVGKETKEAATPTQRVTWESPHYEPAHEEPLPVLTRSDRSSNELPPEQPTAERTSAAQYLQDSWREWFAHVNNAVSPVGTKEAEHFSMEEVIGFSQNSVDEEVEETKIPIHTIYELPPENLLPKSSNEETRGIGEIEAKPSRIERIPNVNSEVIYEKGHRKIGIFVWIAVPIALISALAGAISSGTFDAYLASITQAHYISGTIIYEK